MDDNIQTCARLNLLTSAVNTALKRNLLTLESGGPAVPSTTFEYRIAGEPVIAHMCDAGRTK